MKKENLFPFSGYSVNVPKNKMAYELIMVYYGLSSSYAIFYCHFYVFSKKTIRQDMALRKKSDDLF